jgi:hypothetical protein
MESISQRLATSVPDRNMRKKVPFTCVISAETRQLIRVIGAHYGIATGVALENAVRTYAKKLGFEVLMDVDKDPMPKDENKGE